KGNNNWALLIDPDGFITEGTGSNFFIIKNNTLISPEPRNILRGISRAYIIELCAQIGIKYQEKNIEPFDVYNADEAFMSGTPFCMLPVTSLNSLPIGDAKPGPYTMKLLNAWGENVGVNIVKQIQDWSAECVSEGNTSPSPYKFVDKR
ncbi:MAG: aminotransferase class IV, partial [Silvanigrellaceae bacterium]|nr:aminotransferase class IV [Silvanigrellaceae bacterium]